LPPILARGAYPIAKFWKWLRTAGHSPNDETSGAAISHAKGGLYLQKLLALPLAQVSMA